MRPDLGRRRLVDRRQVGRRRPLEVEALEIDEARQLPDRIVVVVDPQVEPAVVPATVAAAGADDQQGRRLATAPIATGRVGRREAGDEQLRERPAARQERVGEAVDDPGTGQDVALGRETLAGPAAGPREAVAAGVGGALPPRASTMPT